MTTTTMIMAAASPNCGHCLSSSRSHQLQFIIKSLKPATTLSFPSASISLVKNKTSFAPLYVSSRSRRLLWPVAAERSSTDGKRAKSPPTNGKEEKQVEEVEEELPWIQEKALDLVEFTGSVTQAIPGPRVGHSSLPWILAVPLIYLGVTFVFAFVKTLRKFTSPREQRRRLVNKNANLCKSIDELLQKGRDEIKQSALEGLMQKSGFDMEEILRKYIRYVLNEKPFYPDLIADLIQLRKASGLDDSHVAGILNEISRRIVKDKGPVVMDMSGYSEKGLKRKVAVQSLFGKIFYLSEMPEFCSKNSSLTVKEIFGVTDDDAESLRLQSSSEAEVLDSLEKMVNDSDSENP